MRSGIIAIFAVLGVASPTAAQPSAEQAWLGVTRATGAETCSDADTLARIVEAKTQRAVLDPQSTSAGATFDVEFWREGAGFRAVIRARGAHSGVRAIEDAGPACDALVEAVALSLSLAIDKATAVPPSPPREIAPSPAFHATTPDSPAPSDFPAITVAVGGGLAAGVVRGAAPLVTASATMRFGAVRWGLEGLFIPTQALPLSGGAIDVGLVGGSALACLDLLDAALSLSGCGSASLAALRAEGRGFTTNRVVTRAWGAFGAHLEIAARIAGPLGLFARAGVVVPVSTESFTIDSVGTAYAPPRVNLLTSAGIFAAID